MDVDDVDDNWGWRCSSVHKTNLTELLKQLRQIIPRSNGKISTKILRSWEKLTEIKNKEKRENAKDVVLYLCVCI